MGAGIMPKRPKKKQGEEMAIRIHLDDVLIYENVGTAIESTQNSTRFLFPNDRLISLPDSADDLKIVNRLLKDGIKLEQ